MLQHSVTATAKVSQPRILGGVELGGYCKSVGYWGVVLMQHNAYGWKCHKASERVGIDMVRACKWQHNNPHALAAHRSRSDPYSWYCFLN